MLNGYEELHLYFLASYENSSGELGNLALGVQLYLTQSLPWSREVDGQIELITIAEDGTQVSGIRGKF